MAQIRVNDDALINVCTISWQVKERKGNDKIIFAKRGIKEKCFDSLKSMGNTLSGGHLIIGEEAVKMAPGRSADLSLCI